jgi:spermidine synthase
MLDTLGLRQTNLVAVGVSILVALAAFALSRRLVPVSGPVEAAVPQSELTSGPSVSEPSGQVPLPGLLLLNIAFLNGLASLTCEVLWFRYLAFLGQAAYVFPTILGIYLLGLGFGSFIYGLLASRVPLSAQVLGIIEVLLAISVLAGFAASALIFAAGPPRPLDLKGMALVTMFLSTVLMGVAFPLLCSVYSRQVRMLGRRVGVLFAINTAGTVFGSLLPIFVLVPLLGIQRSLLLTSLLYGGLGLIVLASSARAKRRLLTPATFVYGWALALFLILVPSDLCQRVFLATDFNLGRHTDILFYQEGRTGTAIVTRNFVSNRKTIYINGVAEVPISYGDLICFKMLGDLGPMLHRKPDSVLMICFGGGIAAGTTALLPEVKNRSRLSIWKAAW